MSEKLQKIMARAGVGSRRKCETLIKAGRVSVNGKLASIGQRADFEVDEIRVDGKPLKIKPYIYIKAYKPKGTLSSTFDELGKNRPTLKSLVKLEAHLFPVGRLDKQSEGLILLTNDGALTHRLTHPRYMHEKVYEVTIVGYLDDHDINKWQSGVMLDGKITAPATIDLIKRDSHSTKLQIVLKEGRKRQIRRISADFGHPVSKLVRTKIGPLEIGKLNPGEWRYLTSREIDALRDTAFKK
jgi:23S rRNA pseudouridine2605 synthase